MVNDGSSHYLQGQSIKRTVSEQASLLVCEFYPDKTSLFRVGIAFAVASFGTWGTQGGFSMKRLLAFIIIWSLLVLTGSIVSANSQTRHRHRSKFGRKARTAAIIAGGAGVGALAGGKKGAAIGAGGAGLYAFNRKAARRHFKGKTRTAGTVLSGTALGAGVGAAVGHGKGAAIGAGAGALGSYVYRRKQRRRY
jgi:hypothetical protein